MEFSEQLRSPRIRPAEASWPPRLAEELYLVTGSSPTPGHGSVEVRTEDTHLTAKLFVFDLEKRKLRRKVASLHLRSIDDASKQLVIIADDNRATDYLVIASNSHVSDKKSLAEQSSLLVWAGESRLGFSLPVDDGFCSCLGYNSASDVLVSGHARGSIVLWYRFLDLIHSQERLELGSEPRLVFPPSPIQPVCTVLHWHSNPVKSLSFSVDGRFLFSGGAEGVLVIWHTAAGSSAARSFFPRLGAPVLHLAASKDEAKVAVVTADQSLRVVDIAASREEWRKAAIVFPRRGPLQLRVEPWLGEVVASGSTSLRVLRPELCEVSRSYPILTEVQVTSSSSAAPQDPVILLFAFHPDHESRSLATLDQRRGEHLCTEQSLKFWSWSPSLSTYKLVTQTDRPHNQWRVTTMNFQPGLGVLATGAEDGVVKLWRLTPRRTVEGQFVDSWTCSYSFKHRETAVRALSFSRDGSVLAVAQSLTVSLWDPLKVSLVDCVSVSVPEEVDFLTFLEPGASLVVGSGAGESLLVVASPECLGVYDLLRGEWRWQAEERIQAVAVAPSEASCLVGGGWILTGSSTELRLHGLVDATSLWTLAQGARALVYYKDGVLGVSPRGAGFLLRKEAREAEELSSTTQSEAPVASTPVALASIATVLTSEAPPSWTLGPLTSASFDDFLTSVDRAQTRPVTVPASARPVTLATVAPQDSSTESRERTAGFILPQDESQSQRQTRKQIAFDELLSKFFLESQAVKTKPQITVSSTIPEISMPSHEAPLNNKEEVTIVVSAAGKVNEKEKDKRKVAAKQQKVTAETDKDKEKGKEKETIRRSSRKRKEVDEPVPALAPAQVAVATRSSARMKK